MALVVGGFAGFVALLLNMAVVEPDSAPVFSEQFGSDAGVLPVGAHGAVTASVEDGRYVIRTDTGGLQSLSFPEFAASDFVYVEFQAQLLESTSTADGVGLLVAQDDGDAYIIDISGRDGAVVLMRQGRAVTAVTDTSGVDPTEPVTVRFSVRAMSDSTAIGLETDESMAFSQDSEDIGGGFTHVALTVWSADGPAAVAFDDVQVKVEEGALR
ncbi:MAG: hypothetical protein MUF09_08660 [Candidatus Nanopelagicales bacterium]|nr:hypothetical protein [Candidatus Nanopelagicales bacterium]